MAPSAACANRCHRYPGIGEDEVQLDQDFTCDQATTGNAEPISNT
jgi:hypothetical protein